MRFFAEFTLSEILRSLCSLRMTRSERLAMTKVCFCVVFGQLLVTEDNLRGLEPLNAEWVDHAMARTRHQRIILDMDSSESPVYGEPEGAA